MPRYFETNTKSEEVVQECVVDRSCFKNENNKAFVIQSNGRYEARLKISANLKTGIVQFVNLI